MTRHSLATIAATILTALAVVLKPDAGFAQSSDLLSRDSILHDSAAPVSGNPDGDLTIVEWFDYQCPYCKTMQPILRDFLKEDGHIRLVHKDWPIFGGPSIYGAQLALAASFQGKYVEANEALISTRGKLTNDMVDMALAKAGVDLQRAKQDLVIKKKEITALLARNHEQALALGFQGTPAFVIGPYRVPGALNAVSLRQAAKDARAALKAEKENGKPGK